MHKIAMTLRKKEDHMTYFMNDTYYQWLLPYFDIELVVPRLHHQYQDIVKRNDLLLICGGNDINPYYYHQNIHPSNILEDDLIESMDFALLNQFYHARKPIIGICRGIQVINVYFHGALYQDIPTQYLTPICHSHDLHDISITSHSLLSQYFPQTIQVNSFHHQNIQTVSPLFHVNARSEDGLIEGIENHQVFAVQWHPERMDSFHQHQFIKIMFHLINQSLQERE